MDIYSGLFFISILLTSFLGLLVYFNNRKNNANKLFLLLVLGVVEWMISIYFLWQRPLSEFSFLWAKLSFLGPTIIPATLVLFSYFFPSKLEKIRFYKIIGIVFFPVIIYYLVLQNLIVKGVESGENGVNIILGDFFIVFIIYFLIYLFYSFYLLWRQYKENSGVRLLQIKYILIGIFISAILGLTMNTIIPIFGFNKLVGYGPLSIVFFVFFTAYAVTKHQLFNIKVVATEILVGLVSLVLFIELLLSKDFATAILKLIILGAFVYLGIYLIKSVLKEVKQRERIEKMSEDVKKAYEIERNAHEKIKLAYEKEKKTLEKEKEVIKELERLDKAKSQFMMATQHHLRTPLTSMRGYLDLIFGGSYGKIPPKIKEVLKRFEISARNEVKVVDEFLDISQFQLGKDVVFLREGIDIVSIIKEAIEDVKLEAMGRGIYVKMEDIKDVPKIKADEQKLKAAIYNIIDNAVKYTKKGGVAVKLKKIEDNLQVAIKDTGVGISEEEKARLFGRLFERGEQAEKMFTTGRGIGLYISFKIIEAHKGKLWVESGGKGKGSTFYIELPISHLEEEEKKEEGGEKQDNS